MTKGKINSGLLSGVAEVLLGQVVVHLDSHVTKAKRASWHRDVAEVLLGREIVLLDRREGKETAPLCRVVVEVVWDTLLARGTF